MLEVPETQTGLSWIAQHGPTQLARIPGISSALIAAAASGDQQALIHSRSKIAQHLQGTASAKAGSLSSVDAAGPSGPTATPGLCSSVSSVAAHHMCDEKEGPDLELGQLLPATEALFQEAALDGQLNAMKWLLALCGGRLTIDSSLPMEIAAAEGDLSMLMFLRSEPIQAPWDDKVALAAVPEPHCLRWLLSQDPPCPFDDIKILRETLTWQDTELLTWLCHHIDSFRDAWNDGLVCQAAAVRNDLPMLKWLRGQASPAAWHESVTQAAANNGNLPMLQWLHGQQPPCPWESTVVSTCVHSNHLHILRWLRRVAPHSFWDAACTRAAAFKGNLPLLRWLLEEDPQCPMDPMCLAYAAYIGNLPMLQYLVSRGEQLCGDLYYDAAEGRQYHIAKWLHDQNVPRCEEYPFNSLRMQFMIFSPPALMLLADLGCPLLVKDQAGLNRARKSFCTFHGLLRWCHCATSGGPTDSPNSHFGSASGQQLLMRLSSLPAELINVIAAMAGLQHDVRL